MFFIVKNHIVFLHKYERYHFFIKLHKSHCEVFVYNALFNRNQS